MTSVKRYLFLTALLFLVACPGSSDPDSGGNGTSDTPPGTITGTLTAPEGDTVKDTLLFTCFMVNSVCDGSSPNTQRATVTDDGPSSNFVVTNLAAGSYTVYAFKDKNGNGEYTDAVDYFGCNGGAGQCAATPPPAANLSVQMANASNSGAGTVTGTLVFPGDDFAPPDPEGQLNGAANSAANDAVQRAAQQLFGATNPATFQVPLANQDIVAGEVIVKFADSVSTHSLGQAQTGNTLGVAQLEQKLSNYSYQGRTLNAVRPLGLASSGLYEAAGLSPADTVALAADLAARPDVLYAQPNTYRYALKTPNDPYYGLQWHYPAMNLPNAWDIEDGTSNPVTVAVIDTGSISHPDLDAVLVGGYDFVSLCARPDRRRRRARRRPDNGGRVSRRARGGYGGRA